MFIGENQAAVKLLGLAVRSMAQLRYHVKMWGSQSTGVESLHRRRLFFKAYVFDRDLSMRLHSPPLISDNCVELPEDNPLDGYSVCFLPGGNRVNYFWEQVRLAQIQDVVRSELHSPQSTGISEMQLNGRIAKLETLLNSWRESLPESIRPQKPLFCDDYNQLICITALHYTYFQLIIAIHSASLKFIARECKENLARSIRYCITAAKAMVALLDYHDNGHPFAK